MAFIAFKHTDTGRIVYYPEHYADDPVISRHIEVYVEEAIEETQPEEKPAQNSKALAELEEKADTEKETK